ncbi:cysteine-rich receptor-like protein kinase, partial [Trifolium medium]|nr:cysteine-rich receptor-like protein kinase [Trifolium medium]
MNDKDYVGDVGRFNNILWDMLNDLRSETGNTSAKLANKSANLTENQKLYGYSWCLPYLSAENCCWCLSDAIAEVPTNCCRGKSGGTILYPSCGVRFELYPFDKAHDNITWVLPPPTSPRPSAPPGTHVYYNCTRNSTSATYNAYRSNIKTVLDLLSSNSSSARYYNATVVSDNNVDTVYGLFLCTSYLDPKICQSCVIEAVKLISSLCTTAKEAIVWYEVCYVRYSDNNFFSTVEKTPEISFMNDKDYVGQ